MPAQQQRLHVHDGAADFHREEAAVAGGVQHALEQTVAEAERRAKLAPRTPDEQEKVRKALLALMARAQQLPDSGLSVEEALPYDENGLPV